MIPQGYSYAASSLVGFHLAENKTKTAKRYAILCFMQMLLFVSISCGVLNWKSSQILKYFVNNSQTVF
jgi:Na+-driven multidrug efflux pump